MPQAPPTTVYLDPSAIPQGQTGIVAPSVDVAGQIIRGEITTPDPVRSTVGISTPQQLAAAQAAAAGVVPRGGIRETLPSGKTVRVDERTVNRFKQGTLVGAGPEIIAAIEQFLSRKPPEVTPLEPLPTAFKAPEGATPVELPENAILTPGGTVFLRGIGDTGITATGAVKNIQRAASDKVLTSIKTLGIKISKEAQTRIRAEQRVIEQTLGVGGSIAFIDPSSLPGGATNPKFKAAVQAWERTEDKAEKAYSEAKASLKEGESLTETKPEFLERIKKEFASAGSVAVFRPSVRGEIAAVKAIRSSKAAVAAQREFGRDLVTIDPRTNAVSVKTAEVLEKSSPARLSTLLREIGLSSREVARELRDAQKILNTTVRLKTGERMPKKSTGGFTGFDDLTPRMQTLVLKGGTQAISIEGLKPREVFAKYQSWGLIPKDAQFVRQTEDGEIEFDTPANIPTSQQPQAKTTEAEFTNREQQFLDSTWPFQRDAMLEAGVAIPQYSAKEWEQLAGGKFRPVSLLGAPGTLPTLTTPTRPADMLKPASFNKHWVSLSRAEKEQALRQFQTPGERAVVLGKQGLAAVPVAGTIYYWDDMSTPWKVISAVSDLTIIASLYGGFTRIPVVARVGRAVETGAFGATGKTRQLARTVNNVSKVLVKSEKVQDTTFTNTLRTIYGPTAAVSYRNVVKARSNFVSAFSNLKKVEEKIKLAKTRPAKIDKLDAAIEEAKTNIDAIKAGKAAKGEVAKEALKSEQWRLDNLKSLRDRTLQAQRDSQRQIRAGQRLKVSKSDQALQKARARATIAEFDLEQSVRDYASTMQGKGTQNITLKRIEDAIGAASKRIDDLRKQRGVVASQAIKSEQDFIKMLRARWARTKRLLDNAPLDKRVTSIGRKATAVKDGIVRLEKQIAVESAKPNPNPKTLRRLNSQLERQASRARKLGADKARLTAKLESGAYRIGFDSPPYDSPFSAAQTFEEMPKAIVQAIKGIIEEGITGKTSLAALKADAARKLRRLEAAQAKWPTQPEKWSDLLQDYIAANAKVGASDVVDYAIAHENLIGVRNRIFALQDWKALKIAELERKLSKVRGPKTPAMDAVRDGIRAEIRATQEMKVTPREVLDEIADLRKKEAKLAQQVNDGVTTAEREYVQGGALNRGRAAPTTTGTRPVTGGTSTVTPKTRLGAPVELVGVTRLGLPVAITRPEILPARPVGVPKISPLTIRRILEATDPLTVAEQAQAARLSSAYDAVVEAAAQAAIKANAEALAAAATATEAMAEAQSASETATATAIQTQLKLQPELKLIPKVQVKLATAIKAKLPPSKIRRIIRPPRIPAEEKPPKKRKRVRVPDGSVGWQMGRLKAGRVWHFVPPPYRRLRIVVTEQVPLGMTLVDGPGQVAATIKALGGELAKDLDIDIGIVDLTIKKGRQPKVVFTADPKQRTRLPLTAKGAGTRTALRGVR